MNTTLLIAHRWKTLGWILTLPALIAGIYLFSLDNIDYVQVHIPNWLARFMWIDHFMSDNGSTDGVDLFLLDEIISLSLLSGLLLLAFSKEKVEDEWIQKVRLESLQWSVLINTLLLMGFTIFAHGIPFLTVMVYNMFTPLLIFVGRFYWILKLKPMFSKN